MDTQRSFPSLPSSSSSSPQWQYDVFLSFRGEDTGKNFTDHLYAALNRKGVVVFRAYQRIEKGKSISKELLRAIEESKFAIIIFSKSYAASTWCLDELVKIVQCMNVIGQIVFPIFYDVDPYEVRSQRGDFQLAFAKHEQDFKNDMERVQKWRSAMTEVANHSGWHLKDWHESEFIQEIVQEILKRHSSVPSGVVENLVGMDTRLEELRMHVRTGVDDVRIIGICGMGGIGKTTIAWAFYNWMSCQFEGSSFLANVREIARKGDLVRLQEQLLSEILMDRNVKVWNADIGVSLIRRRLRYKRVLIVIDDVDQLSQLDILAGRHDWFGSGSRIIITARDEHLLVTYGVDIVYKAKELNDNEALQLFNCKAFKNDHPADDYKELSNQFVKYCNGLPLALEVLGSFLFRKSLNEWKSALERVKETSSKEILDTLQISFDGLDEIEKNIFLDIACFFLGDEKDYVTRILDSCGLYPDIGIRVLIDKSLVTIFGGKLQMHDILQEMGWRIVRQQSPKEPGKRSRLWLYNDVYHVFTNDTGTENVGGIVLNSAELRDVLLSPKAFSKMDKFRLLIVRNVHFSQGLEYISNELRFLEWHGYPFKYIPSSFQSDKLVELNMCYGHIKQLWKGIKHFNKLRIINLSHSQDLVRIVDFRGVPNLENLILEGCTRLYEVDESVGVLERLVLLNLKDCKSLVNLPEGIYGLKSLKVVQLSGCLKLDYSLGKLGQMECLEELYLCGTVVKQPRSSRAAFNKLRALSLHGCRGPPRKLWHSMLSSFFPSPDPMCQLLHSLSGLTSLMALDLSACKLLEESTPSDFGCFTSLIHLNLSNNNFASLPTRISGLSKLERIYLDNCKRLQSLPELPSNVQCISAGDCTSLEMIADPLILCGLKSPGINLINCLKLVENHDSNILALIFLHRYLQGLYNSRPKFDIVVPGSEIPNWFTNQTSEASLYIQLPSDFCEFKWMGFAVCVVFSVYCRQPYLIDLNDLDYSLKLGKHVYHHNLDWHFLEELDRTALDHTWLSYISRQEFLPKDWLVGNGSSEIEVECRVHGGLQVRNLGVRLVNEQDLQVLNNGIKKFSSSRFPKSGYDHQISEEEPMGGGTVVKRSLLCNNCLSEGECSGSYSSDAEEPFPKRLKEV